MEVKVYVGGHRASLEHFTAALAANRDYLTSENIVYSMATRRTLKFVIKAIASMKSGEDIDEIQENLSKPLGISDDTKTLLIVDSRLIGSNPRPYSKTFNTHKVAVFYKDICDLFKGHSVRLYVETKKPRALAQDTYAEHILNANFETFNTYLETNNINDFRWSKYIHRIQGKKSAIPATIWRYEDYKYIWRDVIGAFSGVTNSQDLSDVSNVETAGINFQGAQLFNKYTKEYPDLDPEGLSKVKDTFLRQFPANMDDNSLSHWNAEEEEALAHSYDDDWYYIKRIDNTEIIEPLDRVNL